MSEARAISLSQVTCYLACPLKYRFQYVDRIPRPWRAAALSFGTSVHAAVEWFHKERLAGHTPTLESVCECFAADWYAQNLEPLVFPERESADALLERGRAMLALYHARAGDATPLAVEQPFEVSLCDPETGELFDLTLRGIMDLVEEGPVVVDLKTAARTLEPGGLDRHLQLSTYALAWLLETGSIPALRLDMLLKTKQPRFEQLPTTRSLADLQWTAQLLREVALAIETEHFYPNPSWRCCECEYFAHCQQWRGGNASLPEDEQLLQLAEREGVGEIAGA